MKTFNDSTPLTIEQSRQVGDQTFTVKADVTFGTEIEPTLEALSDKLDDICVAAGHPEAVADKDRALELQGNPELGREWGGKGQEDRSGATA